MKRLITFLYFIACLWTKGYAQTHQPNSHDLHFPRLATRWDQAIPLGNGMIGALVWQREGQLRFSLDRADLWDSRPMKGLNRREFNYDWVYGQVKKKEYRIVQQYLDEPYEAEPAPSKIPGGAIEFDTQTWGQVESVHLSVQEAVCTVKWSKGIVLKTFVHATEPAGWFRIENLTDSLTATLVPPKYEGSIDKEAGGSVEGDDLTRLGYRQGPVQLANKSITYQQEGWGGFSYQINVRWRPVARHTIEGVWSISSQSIVKTALVTASTLTQQVLSHGYANAYNEHSVWWSQFWRQSAVTLPDSLLEKQWYLDQYKFGSAARTGAPPISLQAVWTADNGRLPPWKGDFHHDLNTQLSYWPAYSGNHLTEAMGYLDHLDKNKSVYRQYTKQFFGKPGLAVPGVTTLNGKEMGGWIQYSSSPTVSAWLGQHYYLHWRYTMDEKFLRERAYPWLKETAIFLESITVKDEKGWRKLPIGSSPEINNNDLSAWFTTNTNYDLALMRFTFGAAAEMAEVMGAKMDATRWRQILTEFPDYALALSNELMVAATLPYKESHRHFSPMMAIHPLSLIRWENGERDQAIIRSTIQLLDKVGPDWWCGYSYAWLANLKARAKDGSGAAEALRIFARDFCSPNSFHLNGDQSKTGKSKYTYRPFTLEGNFAAAAGLQEMLLQSYAEFIEVMPAVPEAWQDVSFSRLRAEGAFLVSAQRTNGQLKSIQIEAQRNSIAKIKLPFKHFTIRSDQTTNKSRMRDGFLEINLQKGQRIDLVRSSR